MSCAALLADRDRDAAGQASLAGVAEGRVDDRGNRQIQVGVGQHKDMIFGAAGGLHPLGVAGPLLVDVPRHRLGADERDRAHLGRREQSVDRIRGAVDQVQDAVGKARLAQTTRPGGRRPARCARKA